MFTLPKLPYTFDALEPYLDDRTMEIHHDKHHQTYVNKLNEALEKHPELQEKSLIELLKSLDSVPEEIRTAVRNNGGGHFSHSLYWEIMTPDQTKRDLNSFSDIKSAIEKSFGSFENFKTEFTNKASTLFGSGWVWLVGDKNNDLKIQATQGHDNPVITNQNPLLVIDCWEHAYYLKFQNRRPEFIEAWWNVVNWEQVNKNYNNPIL